MHFALIFSLLIRQSGHGLLFEIDIFQHTYRNGTFYG